MRANVIGLFIAILIFSGCPVSTKNRCTITSNRKYRQDNETIHYKIKTGEIPSVSFVFSGSNYEIRKEADGFIAKGKKIQPLPDSDFSFSSEKTGKNDISNEKCKNNQ